MSEEDDLESIKSNNDSDEDYGCFFLQPTLSPYNITQKVQQANLDLFTTEEIAAQELEEKNAKVQFKDELVSFEPDLTDDDVNSIESDNADLILDNNFQHTFDYKTSILINNDVGKIYNIEEVEELEEQALFEEDEIIEEIENDFEVKLITNSDQANTNEHQNLIKSAENKTKTVRISTPNVPRKKTKQKTNTKKANNNEVNCKNHCIDLIDSDLAIFIKQLEIHDKHPNFPPLKLHQRKCCDQEHQKISPKNLPVYNGLRSEYGLSQQQLKLRERSKLVVKSKKEARQQLLDDYKNRKVQQNEAVFGQWLRNISKRKQNLNGSGKNGCLARPRTASNGIFPRPIATCSNSAVKKRRKRPQSCVNNQSGGEASSKFEPGCNICVKKQSLKIHIYK